MKLGLEHLPYSGKAPWLLRGAKHEVYEQNCRKNSYVCLWNQYTWQTEDACYIQHVKH